MKYNQLGRSGLFLSELTLGTMTFGDPRSKGTPEDVAIQMIHHYLDAGGNHLDTANVYNEGRSEEIIAKGLKGRRQDVILATKCNFPVEKGVNDYGLSRHNIMRSVEASMERLQTDYIDLLYMHAEDTFSPIDESLRAFDDLVRQGKVRYIGVSNFKAWRLMKALATSGTLNLERFVAAQYQYSLLKREIEYEYTDLFAEEGLGLLPWGPLGGGFLSGKYQPGDRPTEGRIADHPDHTEESWLRRNTDRNWAILEVVGEIAERYGATYSQVAIAWLLQQPTVCSAIMGVRTPEQLKDNLQAVELRFSESELQRLAEVSKLPELYPYRFLGVYGRKAPKAFED